MEYKQVSKCITIEIMLDKHNGLDADNITEEHVTKVTNDIFRLLRRLADMGEIDIRLKDVLPGFEIIEED